MPNVKAALPNVGGALTQRRKVWLTPAAKVPRSNVDNIGERNTCT